jgi:hypothetical protein
VTTWLQSENRTDLGILLSTYTKANLNFNSIFYTDGKLGNRVNKFWSELVCSERSDVGLTVGLFSILQTHTYAEIAIN